MDDPLGAVEGPVNTKVDSAPAVLLFSFGKRRKAARNERPHVSSVVQGSAVEFVGDESERNVVSSEKLAKDLE